MGKEEVCGRHKPLFEVLLKEITELKRRLLIYETGQKVQDKQWCSRQEENIL